MAESSNYIDALKRSLKKKISILSSIDLQNRRQREILLDEESEVSAFQETVDEKSRLIEEIETLDQGFEEVFSHVKVEIEGNKALYRDDISLMQEYIRQIMAKVTLIRSQEQENKTLLEQRIADVRSKSKVARDNQKLVNSYSKMMTTLDSMNTYY